MTPMKINLLWSWCSVILTLHTALSADTLFQEAKQIPDNDTRGRRDVIEEEKYYNIRENKNDVSQPTPWLPHPLPPEDPTTVSHNNVHNNNGYDNNDHDNNGHNNNGNNHEAKAILPQQPTTEKVTDKPTGRGARASNENWIKLPFPSQDNNQDDILTPPQPSGELINSRMPRINFVTQNKQLDTSESRNDKDTQRTTRPDDLRTDFVRPGEDERAKQFKPVYPRQALYYPEEPRRYFDNRYYPREELYSRRDYDPYAYDRRSKMYPVTPVIPRYVPGPRVDRYDEPYDNYVPRKPKRIIYYANLPEVVRTPPNVDLRYRYSMDPYRRFDDDYYGRTGRYDYRFRRPAYPPYAPLRKEERNYRDLAGAGTAVKDKKPEEKVTPTPILPSKEDTSYKQSENNRNVNRNMINSHQYHDGLEITYHDPKAFQDIVRPSDTYLRYDEPIFQGAIDEPYQRNY